MLQKMTETQSRKMMELMSDVIIPVMLSWTHQDSGVCPSSVAKYLFDAGFQVRSINRNQAYASVLSRIFFFGRIRISNIFGN